LRLCCAPWLPVKKGAVRSSTSPAIANVSKSKWMSVCVNLCLWKKLAQGKIQGQWGQLIFCRQLA
jgi:hypothetical protein